VSLKSCFCRIKLTLTFISVQKSDAWRPLLLENSIQNYARLLHNLVYALLVAGGSEITHESGYNFQLTDDDVERAGNLVQLLKDEQKAEENRARKLLEQKRRELLKQKRREQRSSDEEEVDGESDGGERSEEEDNFASDEEQEVELIDSDDGFSSDEEGIDQAVGQDFDTPVVQALHEFVKNILYPRLHSTKIPYSKWNNPLECFLAIYCLRDDGTFKPATDVTPIFAMLHYHIRGSILYEGLKICTERKLDPYQYVPLCNFSKYFDQLFSPER